MKRDEFGRFGEGNQFAKKRKCLYCKTDISNRRPDAVYCCPSHKVMDFREKSAQKPIVNHKKSIWSNLLGLFRNEREHNED